MQVVQQHELKIIDRVNETKTDDNGKAKSNPLATQQFTSETVVVIAIYEITEKGEVM